MLLEVENDNGATRMVLRFGADGSAEEYRDGDMSYLSSSTQLGESAWWWMARSMWPSAFRWRRLMGRCLCVHGPTWLSDDPCGRGAGRPMHMRPHRGPRDGRGDGAGGGSRAGVHVACPAGRGGAVHVALGTVWSCGGPSPDCPDSEAGAIVMELGAAVADVTL